MRAEGAMVTGGRFFFLFCGGPQREIVALCDS